MSKRLLETVILSDWKGRLDTVRRVPAGAFGPWGALRCGMSPEQVRQAVAKALPAPTVSDSERSWAVTGPGLYHGKRVAYLWRAHARFSHGRLTDLMLEGDATPCRPVPAKNACFAGYVE